MTQALVRHFRSRAALYALVVVFCQIGLVATASAAMIAGPRAGAAVAATDECTCEHVAGVMCPMHRRSSSRPLPANAPRWCSTGDDSAFALMPVLGALSHPERAQHLIVPTLDAPGPAAATERPVRLDRPPDSPPPRV